MQAEYDLTPEDLLALTACHHAQSPASRRQTRVVLLVAFVVLSILPGLILITSDDPFLETARAIWPLLMGPVIFIPVLLVLNRYRLRIAKKLFEEGLGKFLEHRTLSLEPDGFKETMSSGSNQRAWKSIERILQTADHAFVYTSGIDAIIIPRRSYSSAVSYDEFVNEIARRAGVEIKRV